MLYDGLLVIGLLFFATALALPFNDGKAIAPDNSVYTLYLIAVIYLYFGLSWTRGGQTLGMTAWRIRVESDAGGRVGWGQCALRLLGACCGLGLLGAAVGDGRPWQDRLSRSVVVKISAPP